MCGRFSLTASPREVAETFGLDALDEFPPRYNIAPTQPILVVVTGPAGCRQGVLVRWGLVPAWVRDPGEFRLLINARAETAAEKPAFKYAMRHRRVLVPASGFYEWHRPADRTAPRQPYWVRPRGGGLVAFAGLMETWSGPDGSEIDTAAILTVPASPTIAAIHDRMPLVVAPEHFDRWLDCRDWRPRDVADLLAPADADLFEAIPVSQRVNRVANDGPDLQQPLSQPLAAQQPTARRRAKPGGRADSSQLKLF
ncbi:MAG: DUF159 family protein [Alphaproteobacteria bacterium]|nr:MAG: DUF159 family protein [Alphaproteobacteria bacterium]